MLNHRSVALLKVESSYNVDPSPVVSADEVLVENFQWSFANARMYQRNPLRPSKGKLPPIYAGTLLQFSFDMEIKGSGAAGTAPEMGVALQAAGLGETIVPATSVTYAPASTGLKSMTGYFYRDGKLLKATGMIVTSCTLNMAVGEVGKVSFTGLGHLVSETDVALPTPAYDSTVPVPMINLTSFAVDGRTPALTRFEVDLGIEAATPDNMAASDGFGTLQITGRMPTVGFDDEDVLVATYDWLNKWQSGASVAINTGLVGSTAGNRYQISLPAVTYTEQSPGDKQGITTRDIRGQAAESSGDDEISIVFT